MSDDEPHNDLQLAPAGASEAECAVCLQNTLKRIASGDGFVPICSSFCLQAWPRVRDLLARIAQLEAERPQRDAGFNHAYDALRRHVTTECGVSQKAAEILLRALGES